MINELKDAIITYSEWTKLSKIFERSIKEIKMSKCAECLFYSKVNNRRYCNAICETIPKNDFETDNYCAYFKPLKKVEEKNTAEKIEDITKAMSSLLQYKNKNYGDSALNGVKIFSKACPTSSICIRLDDKLARISNSDQLRTNDVCDVIGYLVLLAIEMGVTAEDIEKLKD